MAINQKNIKPGQQDDFLRIQDLLYLCLARFFEINSSFMHKAISSRVIPATWICPSTGKSIFPSLFIVYPDIP